MAKKNFKGVPDDYATNPINDPWAFVNNIPLFPVSEHKVVCGVCGIDHSEVTPHAEPKSKPYTDLAEASKILSEVYGGALAPNNPYTKELSHIEFMMQQGLMTQQQAANILGLQTPDDPVLIKRSGHKAGSAFFNDTQIHVITKVEIPGYSDLQNGFKKHGFGYDISEYSDITESQLRKMLMDGFMKITDDIIKQMKEQNK